ncbi:MAG: hypothetical protein K0R94_1476 [Burkholderiales bacterium]|jgi:hypothetical protein|nr:hypothetical protein [Burkholderiales bacterium]
MKKLILTLLAGTCVINSNACNLEFQDNPARPTLYVNVNNQIRGFQGDNTGTSFHHIIPRNVFMARLNAMFNGKSVVNSNDLKNILNLIGAQFDRTNQLFVERERRDRIPAMRAIFSKLGSGKDMLDRVIDGRGERCSIVYNGLEWDAVSSNLSYIPVNGYIGPRSLYQDPGDNFDTYGKFFAKNTYEALRGINNNQDLVNNFKNIFNYKLQPYDYTKWMASPEANRGCYIAGGTCVKRIINQYFSDNNYSNDSYMYAQTEFGSQEEVSNDDYNSNNYQASPVDYENQQETQNGTVNQ